MAWFIKSDQLIQIHGLHDPTNGAIVELANVEAVMVDDNGAQVGGQAWPLTLPHVGGGNYRGMLENTRVLGKWVSLKTASDFIPYAVDRHTSSSRDNRRS